MVTNIRPWGNSCGMTFTKEEMRLLHIKPWDPVEKKIVGGKIIIKPIKKVERRRPSLAEMVASMKKNGWHKLLDKGAPVGDEIW